MQLWQAALWGLLGGLSVEGLDLYRQIRQAPQAEDWSWRRPIPQGLTAYVVSVVIRSGLGVALAMVFAESDQVSGSIGAFGIGVGAPLILEKIARLVSLQAADNGLPPLEGLGGTALGGDPGPDGSTGGDHAA